MRYLEGIIWLALSMFVEVKSLQLGLGTFSSPGPGFMPFLISLITFILSVTMIVQASSVREEVIKLRADALWIIFSMIIYCVILRRVGYIPSGLIVWTLISKLTGTRSWIWALAQGGIITFLSYAIFGVILGLNLPVGIFFF